VKKARQLITCFSAVLTFSAFQAVSVGNESNTELERQSQFVKLLDYEIQNRAFALNTMQTFLAEKEGSSESQFWRAYLALEKLSRQKYQPVAATYKIDQEPRFFTRVKIFWGVRAMKWFPFISLKTIHSATVKYIAKLKVLQALAKPDEADFFVYVVMQEKVQAESMGLMVSGEQQQAIELLSKFVNGRRRDSLLLGAGKIK